MKCSGRQASAAGEPRRLNQPRVRHDQAGQCGTEQEATFEHEVRGEPAGRAGPHPEDGEDHGGGGTDPVQGPTRLRPRLPAGSGQEGQGRPRHQIEKARVGAVVDARRIRRRIEQDRHQDGRPDTQHHGDRDAEPAPAAASVTQEHEEDQRPDEIELFFDRQGPGVLQRRWRGELGEVRLVRVNEVPVVDVEQRGDGIAAQARQIDQTVGAGSAEHGIADEVEGQRRHHEEERRQQAAGPAPPERSQVDAAGPDPLLQEERGDQEARQDEEEVDPQIPALGPAELEVVGHDADHCHPAQAVESGQMAARDGRGGRRRLGPLLHEGGVRHTRSRRHTSGAPLVGCRTRSPAVARSAGSSSPAVRSKAMRGLRSPAGRTRLAAACTGKCGPSLTTSPACQRARQRAGRLAQLLGEGRGEAQHAASPAGQVEARQITGQHGRVALLGSERNPGPEQHVRHEGPQTGGQDDRVALRPAAQEHGGCTLCGSPGGLLAQTGHVTSLEEPSFHGEAG